jgi:hypothetical protein
MSDEISCFPRTKAIVSLARGISVDGERPSSRSRIKTNSPAAVANAAAASNAPATTPRALLKLEKRP